MAIMFPENTANFKNATEEEKRVLRFLKLSVIPKGDFISWFKPPIGGPEKDPDFILFGKNHGLLFLEVRNWTLQQIHSFTPQTFTIRISGQLRKEPNPYKQAKGSMNRLYKSLTNNPEFHSSQPTEHGMLKIPFSRMTVFPNISKKAYCQRGLQWIHPLEKTLLRDDLEMKAENKSEIVNDALLKKINEAFPFRFYGLTPLEIEKLSLLIWPEFKLNLPIRAGLGKERFQIEVQVLDRIQSTLALRLKSGHQVIKGPSGSGKTLVLINRCCYLKKYDSHIKRILVVCYNIALVNYLKELIQENGIVIDNSEIQVFHFFELCSNVLKKRIRFENENAQYYDHIIHEAQEQIAQNKKDIDYYDAIFIDEGQDFNNDMLKTVLALLKPGGDFVIGLDTCQDLYKRKGSWKSLGINAAGRTRLLKTVYRNTVELFQFSQCFLGKRPGTEIQLTLLSPDSALHGDFPQLTHFMNIEEIEKFIIEDIQSKTTDGIFKPSEIAIIYDDKIYGPDRFAYDNRALPMRILNGLDTSGIPISWVSRDVKSKETFDVTHDRVSLISIHSAKGLDFDLVYFLGLDHIHPTASTRKQLISLVYVALTRAKYHLIIPYMAETEFVKRIRDCIPKAITDDVNGGF